MTNTNAAVQLLLQSVSEQHVSPTGDVVTTFDPEKIRFQLYNVDSKNFSAFLRSYKDVQHAASHIRRTVLPGVGDAIAKVMDDMAESAMISISGKSSEDGQLMKMLLRETQEQKIIYSGVPGEKKGGVGGFLSGLGQNNQQQDPQQQPQQQNRG